MNPVNHVAIIMDGNGRWGEKYKNSRNAGHKEGLKTIEKIIKTSIKHNIKFLTLYAFSTENWKRPKKEITYLFNLLENFLKNKIDDLYKQNIKVKFIGNKNFSNQLNKLLNSAEKKTLNNKKLQKTKFKLNEKNFVKYLQTKNIPDPDFLIRTGNTHRLSNFLLWQLAYAEIFFVKKLWPEFKEKDYEKIIQKFKSIKRNFGNINV